MQFFTRFSLKNTVLIFLTVFVLIGGGIYSSTKIGTEMMPDISFPMVSVFSIYPGAAPGDVAETISRPIQKAVSAIEGIKNVNTISNENSAFIMVQFGFSKDMEKAEKEVQDAVNKIKFPDKVQKPTVSKFSYGSIPVMTYSVTYKDQKALGRIYKDKIQPSLTGIKGVSGISVNGIDDENIYIKLDEMKMAQSGVNPQTIMETLEANNISFPVGTVNINKETLPIKLSRKVENIDDIKSIPIIVMGKTSTQVSGASAGMALPGVPAMPSVNTVRLGDIASVELKSEQGLSYTRSDMKPTVVLQAYKTSDGNAVQLAKDIEEKVKELEKDNEGLVMKKISDTSEYITESINGMAKEGVLGALFAIIIIALFLRDIRATIIAVISIPLSIGVALILLPKFDITLNIMSLSGMAVAVGRIVDDSIVVIENIYRRLQKQGNEDGKVIESATGEVSSAITSSTLTTVAVFAPLALVSGIVGKVFASFALTVVICILASLLVAITVVPVMGRLMLLKNPPKHKVKTSRIEEGYKKVIAFALSHRALVVIVSILLLGSSTFMVGSLGMQFLPSDKSNIIDAKMHLPGGTSLEETNKEVLKLEEFLSMNKDVETYTSTVGSLGESAAAFGMMQGSHQASMNIILKEKADPDKLLEHIREQAKNLENDKVKWTVVPQGKFGAQERLEIVVNGENFDDLKSASDIITKEIKDIKGIANITNNLSEKKPEISIKVDAAKAAQKGLNPQTVMQMVAGVLNNNQVATVQNDGKSVDVLLGINRPAIESMEEIQNFQLMSMVGIVKLKDIADIKVQDGPVSITEKNGKRMASISADISSQDTAKTSAEVAKKVKAIEPQFKQGITYSVGGSIDDMKETFTQMGLAMIIAILLVFVTMMVAFKEATAPLAILFSLPFAAVGALFALFIAGRPLSMSGLVGLLMLIGIVVTNAIVLVDRVQQNRQKGMSIRESLIEAGAVRLRPIIMTAAATVMALIPLALGFSEGAIISEELGIVVIGGLTFSTLLTLVIVPVAYSILEGAKERVMGKRPVEAKVSA